MQHYARGTKWIRKQNQFLNTRWKCFQKINSSSGTLFSLLPSSLYPFLIWCLLSTICYSHISSRNLTPIISQKCNNLILYSFFQKKFTSQHGHNNDNEFLKYVKYKLCSYFWLYAVFIVASKNSLKYFTIWWISIWIEKKMIKELRVNFLTLKISLIYKNSFFK